MSEERGPASPRVRAISTPLAEIASLREAYRDGAGCQIVRDSILPRGLADPFRFEIDGTPAGHAGVWNAHFPGRIMELHVLPPYRPFAPALVRALADLGGARELEVQTNLHDGRALVDACADHVRVENLLFEAGRDPDLRLPGVTIRPRQEGDGGPDGEWVAARGTTIVGAGGWTTHYNPPYVDLYLEVIPDARGRGIGSYLVQGLRRAAERAGCRPAARCDPSNEASRRALERGGLRRCGDLLVGDVRDRAQVVGER